RRDDRAVRAAAAGRAFPAPLAPARAGKGVSSIHGGKVLTKAIRYHETGGPEVLRWEDVELREPGPNEVRIHQAAIGFNFIEINTRAGRWGFKPAQLPFVPGLEGVGVISQLGAAVKGLSAGKRVCFASGSGRHSYARDVIVGAESVIP